MKRAFVSPRNEGIEIDAEDKASEVTFVSLNDLEDKFCHGLNEKKKKK